MSAAKIISIVAAVIRDEIGHVLLVRKKGTTAFLQPGGKIEKDEHELDALARELREEIGARMDYPSVHFLGLFEAPAANEAGAIVQASVYEVAVRGNISPQAEIEELIWVDPAAPGAIDLAPLTADMILPLCAVRSKHRDMAVGS